MQRQQILIEADELLNKIDNPNLKIFDATLLFFAKEDEPTSFDEYKDRHIPNASFFDHQLVSQADHKYMFMIAPEDQLARAIGGMGIDNDSEVIVYTRQTIASATRAWWVLTYAGHENVRILNGGLPAWEAVGGQLETGHHQYTPTTFNTNIKSEMFVTKDDVQEMLKQNNIETVYTLPLEAYGGKYITGTSCKPSQTLTDEAYMTIASDEVLAEQLKDESQKDRIITYCGGGIAATVNAVAHLIAGNENVSVYDGSLSEWMGEGLPISTTDESA